MDYFVGPLKEDFEELLGRFHHVDSVRYEDFSTIWRSMDFSSIFYGAMAGCDVRVFSCLAMTTAFYYFLPPYSFQVRVGGLYLLYGLYHTQLATPREKVRVALKDWENICKFQQEALSSQHYDVVYILKKLINQKAFYFAAMPKQLRFRVKRKPLRHTVCEEFRDRTSRVQDLISNETLQEMEHVQKHYEGLKTAISAAASQQNSALLLSQKDLVPRLRSCVLEYHRWQEAKEVGKKKDAGGAGDAEAAEAGSPTVECSQRAQLLASIKSKSYGQAIEASKSRRHRQVEIDTSGSGTDHRPDTQCRKRKKTTFCFRSRMKIKTLNKPVDVKQEDDREYTHQWCLSVVEAHPAKRRKWRERFKW
ncbi:hypothetical protein AAFF_G00203400 [Aldrovandia affinis]|uniref:snRNA-activating protein complex subunit 1-like n=1 Tax=Aldrovandia affinis TaxID=143900 RepID=A0AAD7SX23_9TELE|nr:hypothetical protein AAFF_G00203400 [Aldrovandia affinis]